MIRKAFKMKLYSGCENEYKLRHDDLWEEMKKAISDFGGTNYSIFLDKETNILFGYIELENEDLWNKLSETDICKKWWEYMSDIMETNDDNSPISIDLFELFHLD